MTRQPSRRTPCRDGAHCSLQSSVQDSGPPATVTPGRLLVSPSGPEKDRLWVGYETPASEHATPRKKRGLTGTQPLRHDKAAGPRRGVVVAVAAGGCCCCHSSCVLRVLEWLFFVSDQFSLSLRPLLSSCQVHSRVASRACDLTMGRGVDRARCSTARADGRPAMVNGIVFPPCFIEEGSSPPRSRRKSAHHWVHSQMLGVRARARQRRPFRAPLVISVLGALAWTSAQATDHDLKSD